MNDRLARSAVVLTLMVCALVGHLWMQEESGLPTPTPAESVAAIMTATEGVHHGHDGEDGGGHHAMALACMAVLVAGASAGARSIRVALTPGSAVSLPPPRPTDHWLRHAAAPHRSQPDRVAAGIALLI